MTTQESFNSLDFIERRKQAEAAADRSGYSNDLVKRAVYALGWQEGRNGSRADNAIPEPFVRAYNEGHACGSDARTHADMLSNSVPNPPLMSLGSIEDIDEKPPATCFFCGALLRNNGSCPFADQHDEEAAEIERGK